MVSGVDINQKRPTGETALMSAARNGNLKLLNGILDLNANPNLRDNQGQTALHHAIAFNRGATAIALLQRGADPAIKNSNGKSCLQLVHSMSEKHQVLPIMRALHS